MGYKPIVGKEGLSVFKGFKNLFKELYKNSAFREIIHCVGHVKIVRMGSDFYLEEESRLPDGFVNGFFEKEGYDISNIDCIVVTNIFLYRDDMIYLYAGGCSILEGNVLVPYIPNRLGNFPAATTVLADDTWLVASPSKFFISSMMGINNFHIADKTPNMFGVHMVGDKLVLTAYTIGSPKVDYVYGNDSRIDSLLENMIKVSQRYSFDVKDMYWYVNGSYSKTNARKNEDGEFTIVIS